MTESIKSKGILDFQKHASFRTDKLNKFGLVPVEGPSKRLEKEDNKGEWATAPCIVGSERIWYPCFVIGSGMQNSPGILQGESGPSKRQYPQCIVLLGEWRNYPNVRCCLFTRCEVLRGKLEGECRTAGSCRILNAPESAQTIASLKESDWAVIFDNPRRPFLSMSILRCECVPFFFELLLIFLN